MHYVTVPHEGAFSSTFGELGFAPAEDEADISTLRDMPTVRVVVERDGDGAVPGLRVACEALGEPVVLEHRGDRPRSGDVAQGTQREPPSVRLRWVLAEFESGSTPFLAGCAGILFCP